MYILRSLFDCSCWDFTRARLGSLFIYSANWASQLIWFAYNLKTVKPRKLNVGNDMVMNKSIMYADYGDHRSRNRGLRIQKLGKHCQFLWKFFDLLLTRKPLNLSSWNLDTAWGKQRLHTVRTILEIKNCQNGVKFELVYLGQYRYWWKTGCSFWPHYQPPFLWLCSFAPIDFDTIFLFFFSGFSSQPIFF